MQSNAVTITNRYIANADNAKKNGDVIDKWHQKLELKDYTWVEKAKEDAVTSQDQTINMGDSDIYVKRMVVMKRILLINHLQFHLEAISIQSMSIKQ